MDRQETLGLEDLSLEKPVAHRNASRANKEKRKHAKDEYFLLPELQQASEQHSPRSMLPSHQPLPIAPLGSFAGTLNHWPLRDCSHRIIQTSLAVPTYHLVQRSDLPSASKCQEGCTPRNEPSTLPRVTEAPSLQPEPSRGGTELTVQESTLSVLMHRGFPPFPIDKQYKYPEINPQLTEATPIQRRRWTGSPPANLQKAVSKPNRSYHSTQNRDLKIQPSTTCTSSTSRINSKDDLNLPRPPTPTSAYLKDAHAIPKLLHSPQRLLLVLDLNGTLLYRPRASQNCTPRPYLPKFLKYAFANHSCLVWSSAQPHNVKGICSRLFSRDQRETLLGEWGRNTLGLTSAQYKQKVQVYKRLDRIWDTEDPQLLHPVFETGERWGAHNTLLIDDSAIKASAQPFNHVGIPEFVRAGREEEGDGRDVLRQIVGYLEEARKWSNVNGFVRQTPFKIDGGWRWAAEEESTRT